MNKRPTKLTIVAWIAIVLGTTAMTGGGGLLLMKYVGQGTISLSADYKTIIQLIFGVAMIYGGMEALYRKPLAKNILFICYSVVLLIVLKDVWKYVVISDRDLIHKTIALLGILAILAPTIFCIYVLREKETKLFFEEGKT